jgi:hypothetical protein
VLGLANLAAFAVTALLLHRMTRRRPGGQLRAALLWTANPLLLQVLVAGAHVDAQAVVFGVAAVCVCPGGRPPVEPPDHGGATRPPVPPWPPLGSSAAAGILVGLGFAVKVTAALVGLGLAISLVLTVRRQWPRVVPQLAALGAGFAVTAGAAVAIGGPAMLRQSSRASDMVSIGSEWRVIRTLIQLAVHGTVATDLVKFGAVVLAAALAVLLIRGLPGLLAEDADPDGSGYRSMAVSVVFALALAWLFAWPYVLPWYDALAWALLPLVPLASVPAADGLIWLLLARTSVLGFGYLPARQTDAALPHGLGWLQPVIRHGVTPVILAATTVWLVLLMVPRWTANPGRPRPDARDAPPAPSSCAPPCVLPEAGQKAQPGEAPARGAIS